MCVCECWILWLLRKGAERERRKAVCVCVCVFGEFDDAEKKIGTRPDELPNLN